MLIIFGSIFLLAFVALVYPKEVSTCGALSDGSACTKRRCMGILRINNNKPPDSNCIGIDLGEESYFVPY